jgi:DHA1 family multidrug resistance protein-like MFS transporter
MPSEQEQAQRSQERNVLLWMCVLIAVNQLGFGSVVTVLPLYAQSFGVSIAAIGATVAVYGLARFLIAMPTGKLADILGRRPTLALGGLVSALGNFWCALAGNYAELMIARFVSGAGAGLIVTAGAVVLADISTPERRGRMMAIYQGVFIFSVGIGPLPGGWLAENYGLPAPFAAYAMASVAAGLVAWFAVPETRGMRTGRGSTRQTPSIGFVEQLRIMLAQLGFRLVSAVALMNAVARTGAMFSIVPILAYTRLGLSPSQTGFGFALGSIAGLIVTYPAGVMVDRYGRKAVIVPATICAGLSTALFCIVPSYAWFLFACTFWGCTLSIGGAAPAAYAADCAPPGMNAAAMSTFRMLGDLGYTIGPVLLGILADRSSAETAVWVAGGGLVVTGLLFARWAPETYRGSAHQ